MDCLPDELRCRSNCNGIRGRLCCWVCFAVPVRIRCSGESPLKTTLPDNSPFKLLSLARLARARTSICCLIENNGHLQCVILPVVSPAVIMMLLPVSTSQELRQKPLFTLHSISISRLFRSSSGTVYDETLV
jgi:hypothetical protein